MNDRVTSNRYVAAGRIIRASTDTCATVASDGGDVAARDDDIAAWRAGIGAASRIGTYSGTIILERCAWCGYMERTRSLNGQRRIRSRIDRGIMIHHVYDTVIRTFRENNGRVAEALDRWGITGRVRQAHAVECNHRTGGDGDRMAGRTSQRVAVLRRVVASERREIDDAFGNFRRRVERRQDGLRGLRILHPDGRVASGLQRCSDCAVSDGCGGCLCPLNCPPRSLIITIGYCVWVTLYSFSDESTCASRRTNTGSYIQAILNNSRIVISIAAMYM